MTRRVLLAMAAFALVATACGDGNESFAVAEAVAAPAVAAEAAPAADSGDGEGIQVHGHWTIEVRNPDGTLDDRYEFENALTARGAEILAILVGTPGSYIVSDWAFIKIQGAAGGFPGCASFPAFGCSVVVSLATQGEKAIWAGTITASVDGQVDRVRTNIRVNGEDGGILGTATFTEKLLDSPVPFVAGQEIEVTVEISFS